MVQTCKKILEPVFMPSCRDDLIATAGATHGLHTISHLLFSPGDIVFVENPTYFIATTVFRSDNDFNVKSGQYFDTEVDALGRGFKVVAMEIEVAMTFWCTTHCAPNNCFSLRMSRTLAVKSKWCAFPYITPTLYNTCCCVYYVTVPLDDSGIIPEELEKVIVANKDYRPRELTKKKPYWGMLYVLANFQNPRGMCLPPGMHPFLPSPLPSFSPYFLPLPSPPSSSSSPFLPLPLSLSSPPPPLPPFFPSSSSSPFLPLPLSLSPPPPPLSFFPSSSSPFLPLPLSLVLRMDTYAHCFTCTCLDRCKRVIELARKYNLLVVSDDVYNLIYHDKPPPRLFSYDNKQVLQ